MLEVDGLRRVGLQPVSFQVADGDCLVVQGPSGVGKTLLLRAIADLDPNQGVVRLDERQRDAFSGPEWRRLVGYLPAEPGWWADKIGAHFSDWAFALPLIEALGLPDTAQDWLVSHASTGERLRLALARALALEPRVLLLDEPTAALDPVSVDLTETLLKKKQKDGLSIIWVTHDGEQARRVASRCLQSVAGGSFFYASEQSR